MGRRGVCHSSGVYTESLRRFESTSAPPGQFLMPSAAQFLSAHCEQRTVDFPWAISALSFCSSLPCISHSSFIPCLLSPSHLSPRPGQTLPGHCQGPGHPLRQAVLCLGVSVTARVQAWHRASEEPACAPPRNPWLVATFSPAQTFPGSGSRQGWPSALVASYCVSSYLGIGTQTPALSKP